MRRRGNADAAVRHHRRASLPPVKRKIFVGAEVAAVPGAVDAQRLRELAGPEQSLRGSVNRRRPAIASNPSVGSMARMSTKPRRFGPFTSTFSSQCMP